MEVYTYDCQCCDHLSRRSDVAADDLRHEVRGHADDGDHGDQGEAAQEDEGLGERCRPVAGNGHDRWMMIGNESRESVWVYDLNEAPARGQ